MTDQRKPDQGDTDQAGQGPYAVFADFNEKFHIHEGISNSMRKIVAISF